MKRLGWSTFVDKAFWVMILALGRSVSNNAQEIKENIRSLNENMAVIIAKVANQERRIDSAENRIVDVEASCIRRPRQ